VPVTLCNLIRLLYRTPITDARWHTKIWDAFRMCRA